MLKPGLPTKWKKFPKIPRTPKDYRSFRGSVRIPSVTIHQFTCERKARLACPLMETFQSLESKSSAGSYEWLALSKSLPSTNNREIQIKTTLCS